MPDVEAKLKRGARVADVGCGVGWSSIFLAKHFEMAVIDGIDVDEESIAEARRIADQQGVNDRVQFHACAIEEFKFNVASPYDLVTAFECLHDIPYPVQAPKPHAQNGKPRRNCIYRGYGRRRRLFRQQ